MAGPFSIQKVPRGLLSLFDMKGLGSNPVDLAQQIQPVVDVTEAYSNPLLAARNSATVTAEGQTVDLVVPNGERWRVYGIMVAASSTNPGDALHCQGMLRLPGTVNPEWDIIVLGNVQIGLGASLEGFGTMFPVPLWLDSGNRLRAWVTAITATGTMTMHVGGIVQRLQV